MPSYLELCIQACRRQGVVLDTNVFNLFRIGCWNARLIESGDIERLSSYSPEDFKLLLALLIPFSKRVVTPGIVTETCNLLDTENRKYKGAVFHALSQLSVDPAFLQFGLADASISDLSNRGHLIITDDLKLKHFLETSGRFSLNFTQIRTANWLHK